MVFCLLCLYFTHEVITNDLSPLNDSGNSEPINTARPLREVPILRVEDHSLTQNDESLVPRKVIEHRRGIKYSPCMTILIYD